MIVGTERARDKKTGTVLDGLVIACYQQLMSKALTDPQSTVLHNLYNRLMDDASSFTALVAANDLCDALERIYFLERKLRCAEDYLVPALMWYADGPQHQRADMALQAYNDVTE